jgi:hypothetical protein
VALYRQKNTFCWQGINESISGSEFFWFSGWSFMFSVTLAQTFLLIFREYRTGQMMPVCWIGLVQVLVQAQVGSVSNGSIEFDDNEC